MVNHPNRSKRMAWKADGDQWIAEGSLGQYSITEWKSAHGSNFAIKFKAKSHRSRKGIGEFSTLNNAKVAVETYDNYRSA